MNPKKIAICSLFLVVAFHAGTSYAARVEHGCDAEKFIPCPSFRTSRTIGEHTPIIDNHVAGFTRSKGKWTITVGYGPAEKCAIVSLYIDMGPLDFDREYKRVFINGGGVISDSGSFMHKIDDLESGLRIHNSTCRVPAPQQLKTDAESKEQQALEEERERLALEEEQERLALEEEQRLEEERERLALEEEQERLALEEEQRLEEERERLALEEEQERLALEEERERQRLAQQRRERERQRLAQQRRERERQRLAQQQRERERRRLAQERRERARRIAQQRREQARQIAKQQRERERLREERRSRADAAAAMGFIGGILKGLAGGSGNPGAMGFRRSPSYGGSGGGQSCARAKRRVDRRNAQTLASLKNARGMCAVSRGYVRMFENAKRTLAGSGCPASVARRFDQPLAQARRRVRATCR